MAEQAHNLHCRYEGRHSYSWFPLPQNFINMEN